MVVQAGCRSQDRAAQPPPVVSTAVVAPAVFADRLEAIASLDSERIVQLASQATGRVTRLLVRQGDLVRAGQLVLELDQAQLRAELATLRSRMLSDQFNDARFEKLVRAGAASALQRDQYRQSAIASRQAYVARQADLTYRVVRAPVAGVIGELNLRPGDVLQAGVPFTQLVSNHGLLAEIELPANRAGQVRVGLPVTLYPPAPGTAPITTRLATVEPSVNPSTQLLMAQAPLRQASSSWRNGMRLRADVLLATREQPAVPATAVTRLAGQTFVFVVGDRSQLLRNPGRVDRQALAALPAATRFAMQVPVRLGPLQDNRYPVLAGVSPGQRVITSGLMMLRHGLPVRAR